MREKMIMDLGHDQDASLRKMYGKKAQLAAPASHLLRNCIRAFFVGGIICTIGEFFRWMALNKWALDKEATGSVVSIIMIFIGIFLTGLGVYDRIGAYGGAGSAVPITGFANTVASPAMEFKGEGWVTGTGARIFTIAGPVITYGISASILVGLLTYFLGGLVQ
jgi:stage V sporulation protein AC